MNRRYIILLCMLLPFIGATAQQVDNYRYYKLYEDIESNIELIDDSTESNTVSLPLPKMLSYQSLFLSPSAVANDHRGINYYDRKVLFNGVSIPNISLSRARRLALVKSENLSTESEHYTLDPAAIREQSSVALNLTTRNYTAGASGSTAHYLSENWALCSDIYLRTGRDLHVDGVFTSEASLSLSVIGRPDTLSSLNILFTFVPSERATRKAATAELFALTGDNYYNPAWGYQAGKVRSANITRTLLPTLAASYSRALTQRLALLTTIGATMGERTRNGIDWLGAATPLPDNYRKLPSYFDDPTISGAVTNVWVSGDSRYTQINFDELHRRNSLQKEAIYLMYDRVENTADVEAMAALKSTLSPNATLHYGIKAHYARHRNFKRATDLLGGKPFTDIDYFLVDDDTFSNMLQNNLQSPNRKVDVGDRYGYHYAITDITTTLFAAFDATFDALSLRATAQVGGQTLSRKGYFQKELFANSSLGRSKTLHFAPWGLSVEAKYKIDQQHTLYTSLHSAAQPTDGETLFLQSQYNNRTVESPELATLHSALFEYRYGTPKFALNTTLFVRYNNNQRDILHLYYDAASEFSDIVISDLATLAAGAEAEAHYDFAERWSAAVGVSGGVYKYSSNPNVKVYADDDNALLADQTADIKSLNTGRTPQITLLAQLGYHSHGWRAVLEGEYYALRHVAPSIIRRTEDVLSHCATDDIRRQFTSQERLPDAFTLNLTLSKSIYLSRFDHRIYSTNAAPRFSDRHPHSRINIFFAVNNLLGTPFIYRGYESSRIRKKYIWEGFNATPLPSYYLYAYPRTYYLQIGFVF